MIKIQKRIRIDLRIIKTAAAVMAAVAIVDSYGDIASKLVFAKLGVMNAIQPTFKASLKTCVRSSVLSCFS